MDDIFRRHFQMHFLENVWISIKFSSKFVPRGQINNVPSLFQIIVWCRPGDKPLSEPMMVSLLKHICVTRPQWVNGVAWVANTPTSSSFWIRWQWDWCLVHTKFVCNTSLHVPTQITEPVKTGSFDNIFCIIRYQYVSKQFSVRRSRLYSVCSQLVSSSDRVKSPVHLVGTTFPNSPSPSAVHWNPFGPSCTSFPLRPIPF